MSIVENETLPLRAGDKLSLDEFLRRWDAMPNLKLAELIGGVVYMPSPLSIDHGEMECNVGTWLGFYRVNTPCTGTAGNATTILGHDSPQPDKHLRMLPEVGGRTWVEDKLLHGAPEFVAEICVSSSSYDLNQKKDVYEENGVDEYLAVLVHEREIRWHRLIDDQYQIMPPDADGILRSHIFPGLWLDGKALLAGDLAQVLKVLQKGLDSPEHAAFVAELQRRRTEHGEKK